MTPAATVIPASLEMLLRRPHSLSALLELSAAAAGEVNPAPRRGVAERAAALPRTDGAAVYGWSDSGLVLEAPFLRDGRISYWNRFCRNTVWLVRGHASELTQVIVHLLLNAAAALEDAPGTVTIGTRLVDDRVQVTIADTGRGIPPQNLRRVFDPFVTTRPRGSSSGMGLAVCHGIIERHGGTIGIDGTPGRGTVVTVRLPRASADRSTIDDHTITDQPRERIAA